MKFRSGFVSNSSSSSFVVQKKYLTPFQIECIKNHGELAKMFEDSMNKTVEDVYDFEELDKKDMYNYWSFDLCCQATWEIEEKEDTVEGWTTMDNFNMKWFLRQIGLTEDQFEIHGD